MPKMFSRGCLWGMVNDEMIEGWAGNYCFFIVHL